MLPTGMPPWAFVCDCHSKRPLSACWPCSRYLPEIDTDSPTLTSSCCTTGRQARLLGRVLGERFRCELSALHIARIQFRVLLPLFRQVLEWKDRRHRTDGNAGATINTL